MRLSTEAEDERVRSVCCGMVMDRAWGKPRDGTNGVVLQMGVPLGGWGLTMPEHLAEEVAAVAAGYGDRGEAVPKVMNADIVEPDHPRTRCQGFWMSMKCPSPGSREEQLGRPPGAAARPAPVAWDPKRHGFGPGLAVGEARQLRVGRSSSGYHGAGPSVARGRPMD